MKQDITIYKALLLIVVNGLAIGAFAQESNPDSGASWWPNDTVYFPPNGSEMNLAGSVWVNSLDEENHYFIDCAMRPEDCEAAIREADDDLERRGSEVYSAPKDATGLSSKNIPAKYAHLVKGAKGMDWEAYNTLAKKTPGLYMYAKDRWILMRNAKGHAKSIMEHLAKAKGAKKRG